jgi:hypothetical protein
VKKVPQTEKQRYEKTAQEYKEIPEREREHLNETGEEVKNYPAQKTQDAQRQTQPYRNPTGR